MAIKIPHGFTPLKEALNISPVPCEHCDNGTVWLDNGRSFPCVYCGGTGEYDYDEIMLEREGLMLCLCPNCAGQKHEDCPDCLDGESYRCPTCDGTAVIECEKCNGNGYVFLKRHSLPHRIPGWAIAYANGLMDEYGN